MIADWLETALERFEQHAVVSDSAETQAAVNDVLLAGRAAVELLRVYGRLPAEQTAGPKTET